MRGVKVQGHASMSRSSSCPGAIICTDHQAGMAAFKFREANEQRDIVIANQSAQIEKLNAVLKMMAEQIGMEIPMGGDDGSS